MPTRKQKRREAKSKRHDYEFVYVDDEGNEVDAPPEEEEPRHERRNGSKPAASPAKKAQPQRGARRVPQPPSWQRAAKRAALLGVVVFFLFSLSKSHNYPAAALLSVVYTALFVPFTYAIDRFAYRRWQARQQQQSPTKR
jgi:hypothetical protein